MNTTAEGCLIDFRFPLALAPPLLLCPSSLFPPKVASANYFRDGGHVETKWGKFGEAGQAHGEGDSEDEEDEEEEVEDVAIIERTETIDIGVILPDMDGTLAQFVAAEAEADVEFDERGKCACFTDYWKLWLLFLLCLAGIALMIYFMITQYGAYAEAGEANIMDCH